MSAPLILAIQPDRRQQPHLASIARQVSAELLLTESVERAMAVLANRLPDLILTPALLSHKDETALTERLRQFGDVAAHIHTLTIPILETAVSPSRKGGVLSSLRKQKRNGKAHAAETVGCTVDTFAEQISIYLRGAVEARVARGPIQTPSPTTTFEAGPSAEKTTPDNLPSVEELSAETPAAPEAPREDVGQRAGAPAENNGLPTIEELSARTPPVPEPATSVEMRMDSIAVITPSISALPVPAASVETGVNAIAAIDTALAVHAGDCPMPEVAPRVAELTMELPPAQLTAGGGVVATMPVPAPVETGVEAVTAMMPLVSAPAVPTALLTPVTMPHVAEVSVLLPPADTTRPASSIATMLPAPPSSAVEMSMTTFAAMVPVVKPANDRPLPIPAVMSPLVELRMPAHAAPTRVAVPTVPEYGSAVSVETIAAMASVVSAAAADRLAPLPAATPFTAELPLKLPSTDVVAHATAPVAPESPRSVGLNADVVAHIAPVMTDQGLVPVPATALRVSEVCLPLPAANVHPGVLAVPELPAMPADANMDAVAAMMPIASAVSRARPVPVPAASHYVVELPMSLPVVAAGSVDPKILVVPAHTEPRIEIGMQTATANTDAGRIPADASAPPVSAAVTLAVRKRAKKQAALQERKAARKNGKKQTAHPPADDSGLFDPDEVRFSALIAKLDEVALRGDEAPDGDVVEQVRARKPATSKQR